MNNEVEGHDASTTEEIDMAQVLDDTMGNLVPGKVITGEVVTVDSNYVYVNVGAKSDGCVSVSEFDDIPSLGEVIHIMLMNKRLVDGVYPCSARAALSEKGWVEFMEFYNTGNRVIKGRIKSATSKGKLVQCLNMTAFLPFSLAADLKSLNSSEEDYSFHITQVSIRGIS